MKIFVPQKLKIKCFIVIKYKKKYLKQLLKTQTPPVFSLPFKHLYKIQLFFQTFNYY